MAKHQHAEAPQVVTLDPSEYTVYNDSEIETWRINGYIGILPYRHVAELSAAENYAYNSGRAQLFARNAQATMPKAEAAAKKAGEHFDALAWLRAYAASWSPNGDGELKTVGARRAAVADQYLIEKFPALAPIARAKGSRITKEQAAVEQAKLAKLAESRNAVMAHPRHGVEIARRLAAQLAEYVAPTRGESSGETSTPTPAFVMPELTINLDDAA